MEQEFGVTMFQEQSEYNWLFLVRDPRQKSRLYWNGMHWNWLGYTGILDSNPLPIITIDPVTPVCNTSDAFILPYSGTLIIRQLILF